LIRCNIISSLITDWRHFMDVHSPLGTILLVSSIALVLYLFYNMFKTVVAAKNSLAEVGNGIVIGFLERQGEAKRSKAAFYEYAWKPAEARVMLKELKRQLDARLSLTKIPELAGFKKEDATVLLTLAVFAKVVIPTEEIRQRITFLELLIARDQEGQSSEHRSIMA